MLSRQNANFIDDCVTLIRGWVIGLLFAVLIMGVGALVWAATGGMGRYTSELQLKDEQHPVAIALPPTAAPNSDTNRAAWKLLNEAEDCYRRGDYERSLRLALKVIDTCDHKFEGLSRAISLVGDSGSQGELRRLAEYQRLHPVKDNWDN